MVQHLLKALLVRTLSHLGRVRKLLFIKSVLKILFCKTPQSPREGAETVLPLVYPVSIFYVITPGLLDRGRKHFIIDVWNHNCLSKNPHSPREGTANWGNYDAIFKIGLDI